MTDDAGAVDWIAADWGNTRLRAWAMSAGGEAIGQTTGPGVAALSGAGFAPALADRIGHWLADGRRTPVLACGAIGSREGWTEIPYRKVPCTPRAEAPPPELPCDDPRIALRILPGLCQDNPAAVMRGEETQIAGFLAGRPDFDGVLCLPGTHSFWVQISAGEVVSFQSFMTGELFDLLAARSILRHGMGQGGWEAGAFRTALDDALSKPERVAARLFELRAEYLLKDLAPEAARARLSGLLVGIELAAARPYWLGQEVAVIAGEGLAGVYGAALTAQGMPPASEDSGRMVRAGLARIRATLD